MGHRVTMNNISSYSVVSQDICHIMYYPHQNVQRSQNQDKACREYEVAHHEGTLPWPELQMVHYAAMPSWLVNGDLPYKWTPDLMSRFGSQLLHFLSAWNWYGSPRTQIGTWNSTHGPWWDSVETLHRGPAGHTFGKQTRQKWWKHTDPAKAWYVSRCL